MKKINTLIRKTLIVLTLLIISLFVIKSNKVYADTPFNITITYQKGDRMYIECEVTDVAKANAFFLGAISPRSNDIFGPVGVEIKQIRFNFNEDTNNLKKLRNEIQQVIDNYKE